MSNKKLNRCFSKCRHTIIMLVLTSFIVVLSACGSNEPETFTIGVINLTPVLEPVFENQ